ncbi:transposase, partial [Streptococcus suis]
DHLLRQIEEAIDFSFICDLVANSYSDDTGRPRLDPLLLIKIPILRCLFGIRSMRQTIKEIEVNTAYRCFLVLRLDDNVPHFTTYGKNYVRRFQDRQV